jgi:hypothetical protein
MWPCVCRGLDFALGLQSRHGEIAWALKDDGAACDDALVTGCSSIYKSLECGLAIADTLGLQAQEWALARERLGRALRAKPHRFDRTWASKARYSMDWFYPVLSGVITGYQARQRLRQAWEAFVQPGLGCRCVSDQPWITVAESCELVMALAAAGQRSRAAQLFSWLHISRTPDGGYWTGYQTELDIFWPEERPTWTAGAVLLAADALACATPAAGLFTSQVWEPASGIEFRVNAAE